MKLRRKLIFFIGRKKEPEYTKLGYLENTGNNWINLDYVPTSETGVYAKVMATTGGDLIGLGVREDTSDTRLYFIPKNANLPAIGYNQYFYIGTGGQLTRDSSTPKISIGQNVTYEQWTNYENSKVTRILSSSVDVTSETMPSLLFTPTKSLYLFAGNVNGAASNYWRGRIYAVKITEGDKLVMDLIPVLDKSGEPCMFDKVTGQFYYNQGTGEFTYG